MKIKVTIPFAIALAAFLLSDGSGLFTLFLLAAAVHELGHILAMLILRIPIREIRLELTGAVMYYDSAGVSYAAEAIIAFCGPLVGAIAALVGARLGYTAFAGVSILLSVINLVPAAPLDGGRLLAAMFAKAGLPEAPLFVAHCAASLGLLLLGVYVFYVTGGNFTCILLGAWLLFAGLKNRNSYA